MLQLYLKIKVFVITFDRMSISKYYSIVAKFSKIQAIFFGL